MRTLSLLALVSFTVACGGDALPFGADLGAGEPAPTSRSRARLTAQDEVGLEYSAQACVCRYGGQRCAL